MISYDAVVIGAGMSGLGAGIRLAHFGKKVCVLDRHALWGGLNSFYKKAGRPFDVGLHAMTNFAPRGSRGPLSLILRQLRIDRDELELQEQNESEVRFPSASLRFSNDLALLDSEVARTFPGQVAGYEKLKRAVREYDDGRLSASPEMAQVKMREWLTEPLLISLLLCPLLFYGSATERDMTWHQFVIMFKAVYLEGFCRPVGGVRRLLHVLKREYTARGGELRMKAGAKQLIPHPAGGVLVELENGETLHAKKVLSSAGKVETARLLGAPVAAGAAGRLSFVETIFLLKKPAPSVGWKQTILFFSHADDFKYEESEGLISTRSGIVCAPENFVGEETFPEGVLRVTSLANYDQWVKVARAGDAAYQVAKAEAVAAQRDSLTGLGPDFAPHLTFHDCFTPLTVEKFTAHDRGAVYGAPEKVLDGATSHGDVFLCGTDQGYLGIVGALLSGVIMANQHILAKE